MKKFFLLLLCFFIGLSQYASAERRPQQISWISNFDEGVNLAQSSGKPMLLLFTGSDWCTWCIKLEDEVFKTSDFAEAAGDKFVFVKLDFPLNRTAPSDVTSKNKQLQKRFGVTGFPTVVILDPHQKRLGTVGYRPGGGRQYAQFLQKIVNDNMVYQQELDQVGKQPLSGLELRRLYEQSIELGRFQEADEIISAGATTEQRPFFLLERYRRLAANGNLQSQEAAATKKELLSLDPDNHKMTCYQMALIEFDLACKECSKSKQHKDKTNILKEYIEQYGTLDQENLWRLQLLIAQIHLEQNNISDALQMLQASCQSAPPSMQGEITTTLTHLQEQVK